MRKIRFILIFFFAFISVEVTGQSLKDTIKLKEVSVTSKRFKKEEAGIKITKVDTLMLIEKVNTNLASVLSENTTVYIKDYGRGAMATASFRGTASTHTQVNWNGININSPMLGMVDFSQIPVFIIDDVSILYGGASVSEQSGGLGGSIDINSTVNWDNRLSGRYIQTLGSYSSFGEFGQFNIGNKKIQSKTRVYRDYSKNDYPYTNKAIIERPRVKNENAEYWKKGLAQELYFNPAGNHFIKATTWMQDAQRCLPTVMSYEGDEQCNLNTQEDNTRKATIDWDYYGDKNKVSARIGYDFQELNYYLVNEVSGLGSVPAVYSCSKMHSWYNHAALSHDFSKSVSMDLSADLNRVHVYSLDSVSKTGYTVTRWDKSVFGRFSASMWNRINIMAMCRGEMNGDTISPVIYNLGVGYRPLKEKELYLKAGLTRNYHHPTLNDLYWVPGGNTSLRPEKGYTGEFSIQYYSKIKNVNTEMQVTTYRSQITDWIIWLPSFKGYWQPFNIKTVKSYGAECHVKLNGNTRRLNYRFLANFAYTRSLNYGDKLSWGDESIGKQLPYIPVRSFNLMTYVEYKGFYITYQNNSYSERFRMSSNQVTFEDDSEEVGASSDDSRFNWYYPYYMNNLAIGKKMNWTKFYISSELKIENLFNEEYRSVLMRYMPGRNYTLVLMIGFK